MKKLLFVAVCAISTFISATSFMLKKEMTAQEIIQKMHKRNAGKWFKTFTFSQKTENYKNDSLINTSTWHETIVYPYHFRITFGEPAEGNAVIYVKDSSYSYKNGKLTRRAARGEDITFLLGGMYFMPFDSVAPKMIKEGFDMQKAHECLWHDRPTYVIGATKDDEKTNQLWIDKKTLVVVRFIKYLPTYKEEAVFSNHIKIGKGYTETNVTFYINDKLYQKESYYNYKANEPVNMKLFDVNNFMR
jgi:hypothetical protein